MSRKNDRALSVRSRKGLEIFFLFLFLLGVSFLTGGSFVKRFQLPLLMARFFVFLLYAPFALLIFWKLICDCKDFKRNVGNVLYYGFALYYSILFCVRFLCGTDVKESLYYSLILFGSLALYFQVRDKRIYMEQDQFELNFMAICLLTIVYRLSYIFFLSKVFDYPLVNSIITTSIGVILLPFMMDYLYNNPNRAVRPTLIWIEICAFLVFALTTSSRIIFFLVIIVTICSLIKYMRYRSTILRELSAVGCAVLAVAVLYACNVETVRYAVDREILGMTSIISSVFPAKTPPVETPPQENIAITSQIQESDTGRIFLMKTGIEQIKQNPLFGTGDVFYFDGLVTQSSHNFIIETLTCYGIIGFAILGGLLFFIVSKTGFFSKKTRGRLIYKVSIVLTAFYFFGISMVQPIMYNSMICPLFLLILLYYEKVLSVVGNDQLKTEPQRPPHKREE